MRGRGRAEAGEERARGCEAGRQGAERRREGNGAQRLPGRHREALHTGRQGHERVRLPGTRARDERGQSTGQGGCWPASRDMGMTCTRQMPGRGGHAVHVCTAEEQRSTGRGRQGSAQQRGRQTSAARGEPLECLPLFCQILGSSSRAHIHRDKRNRAGKQAGERNGEERKRRSNSHLSSHTLHTGQQRGRPEA